MSESALDSKVRLARACYNLAARLVAVQSFLDQEFRPFPENFWVFDKKIESNEDAYLALRIVPTVISRYRRIWPVSADQSSAELKYVCSQLCPLAHRRKLLDLAHRIRKGDCTDLGAIVDWSQLPRLARIIQAIN